MAILSMFYGIVIKMYNGREHNPPHFHAEYGEYRASFDFNGTLIEGDMPKGKIKLIVAWSEIHRDELEADWNLALQKEVLFRIDPLR